MHINTFYNNSDEYPTRLHDLHDPPSTLYVSGQLQTELPLLAVIGSRRMSRYARQILSSTIPELVSQGLGIVSGLAIGVDGTAHRETISSKGYTLAVLPSAPPNIHPRSHVSLAQSILDKGGGLISENKPSHSIRKSDFIARNRIIAAIADGLLVIEAAVKSGTLSTVGFALDLGKPVMAFPGSIFSPNSQGTHNLIKQGATLVEKSGDIFEALQITVPKFKPSKPAASNTTQKVIIDLLWQGEMNRQELLRTSEIPADELNIHLSLLEINGVIKALGGDTYGLR